MMKKVYITILLLFSIFITTHVKAEQFGTYNFGYNHEITCDGCESFSLERFNSNIYFYLQPNTSTNAISKIISITSDVTTKFDSDYFLVSANYAFYTQQFTPTGYACLNYRSTSNDYTMYDPDGGFWSIDGDTSYYCDNWSASYSPEKSASIGLSMRYGSHDWSGSVNCFMLTANDNNVTFKCPKWQNNSDISRIDLIAFYRSDLHVRFNVNLNFTTAISDSTSIINNNNENTQKEIDATNKNTQATKEVNNTLKDDSVDNQQAEGFFNDFDDNSHGLSGIITAPLNMINNLASATCLPITINIPFVDTEFNLPCMSTIYQQNFGNLFSIYRTITFGIVAYYVCVNIFALVKGFKDPENDKVEVVEL